MVFPGCARSGAVRQPWPKARLYPAPIVRAVSCYETRRAERQREREVGRASTGRGRERTWREREKRTESNSQPARRRSNRQTPGPLSFLLFLLWASSRLLLLLLLSFARPGPVVAKTAPRRVKTTYVYTPDRSPPGSGSLASGLSSFPHRDLVPSRPPSRLLLTPSLARARARSLVGPRLDLRSTSPAASFVLSPRIALDDKVF